MEQQAQAQEIFYLMKSLDVEIAAMERRVASSGSAQNPDDVRSYLEKRRRMEQTYDQLLSSLGDRALSPQEQVIMRVTRNVRGV